jgi:cell division protein FtsW (lipid II flippase)
LWLKVPILQDVYFQPSELLKLLVVAFLASYFEERDRLLALTIGNDRFRHYAYIAPLVIMWSLCIVLLVWQKDLGAATLFFVVFLGLLILATGDWRYLIAGTVLLLIVGTMGYIFIDVVATRFSAWWNPWPNASGIGYQTVQSLYAMASGNIIGQGIGQGYPGYVPVAHTDFIFSAIAEEWGLVGTMAILACIGILAYRGFRIANLSRDLFSTFLASGITLMLAVQSIMIMAGVTKLIPLTGVTLPFVSYGGSSLVMSCLMIGILLKLSIKSGDHGPIADANGTW